jgi:hypothetical protein
MTWSEWKVMMEDLLEGVEQELRSSAPTRNRVALNTFRSRLNEGRTIRGRKHFEQELEVFIQSDPSLRGAAKRYLRKKIPPVIEAAVAALKQAQLVLAKYKTNRLG